MKTRALREAFLAFFKERGHSIVPSSSLVPVNDPTLLFTNAGMVQFKDVFLGLDTRSYTRAASSQRCVRAGGKHNDLENVGYTARHHTFFEMLGNFSFGDYFKRDAIQYAWEFLTKVLKLPPERLWVTVFENDDEAADIWLKEIKVDPKRFSRCGEKDNFWAMGDTGPCGPCTEIFYDHGPEIAGGPPGSKDEDGDRFVEIWNLVFMQYNRAEDGRLQPLPKPSVDTGMGLERIAAVMQGVHSNYEIDIFQHLIKAIAKLANAQDLENKSLRVIADHIRACAFLIIDGVVPSNEGRGYVLRRICRRAIRHGLSLGLTEPFFYKLVKPLGDVMGDAYPELNKMSSFVEKILQQEELQFARTLEQGMRILEQDLASVSDGTIPGETLFKLYDTYGFPVDLTADIARERHLNIDMDGFNEAMLKQKTRAREASQFIRTEQSELSVPHSTEFLGYESLENKAKVVALYRNADVIKQLNTGEEGTVVLEHTPFYAESGGQVGDKGELILRDGGVFEVQTTRKSQAAHLHYGVLKKGTLHVGDEVVARVDHIKRRATALNHSATHLLHAVLRHFLGPHVQQKGSLVEPERLRFDFSHFEPLTFAQLRDIEQQVNEQVRLNTPVETDLMDVDTALKTGAMALFGEKYGEKVRVLRMGGDFSVELCGGTHISRTGDIGLFKIISETGIAAGVRRIEALTGLAALQYIEDTEQQFEDLATNLKCHRALVLEKCAQLISKNKVLEKELQQVKVVLASGGSQDISAKARDVHGVKVLTERLEVEDPKILRDMVDKFKARLKTAVVVLASVKEGKVSIVVGVTADCTGKVRANDLTNYLAEFIAGKGGGNAEMAQAGGNNVAGLTQALEQVDSFLAERLKPKIK